MKKTIITIIILVVVIILGLIAYSAFFSSKVPQAFIDKHNETFTLAKDAEQLSDLTSMPEMNSLDNQMKSEDYNGALKSIEAALNRKKEAASKLKSIDSGLTELSILSAKISNAKIKTSADKFIDMSKKENAVKTAYNNLQIKMLEKTKEMVGILAKSKTITPADTTAINGLVKQIGDLEKQVAAAEKEVNDVQSQYKGMEKEFFGLAGLEIIK